MSQKAYEDACLRAELFGQPLPDKAEFLESHKHLDVVEFVEVDIKTAENTAMLGEEMKGASGGFSELNTILDSTQTKLNRLKGVCGSLTNFFRLKINAKDNLSYSSEPSYVGQTNFDKDSAPHASSGLGSINNGLGPNDDEMTVQRAGKNQDGGDINSALKVLNSMQTLKDTNLLSKATAKNMGKQMSNQVSKLDQMIHQADWSLVNHQAHAQPRASPEPKPSAASKQAI